MSSTAVAYGLFAFVIVGLILYWLVTITRERGRLRPPTPTPTHCPECGWPRGVHTGACSRNPLA